MTAVFLAAALAAQSALPFKCEKVFLPPRDVSGNTNLSVLQPIDEAAWIWHPDSCGDAERIRNAGSGHIKSFPVSWSHPEFLRFRVSVHGHQKN